MTGSTKDRPRSGQPHVTTRRQDNLIRLCHLRDRYRTAVSTAATVVSRHHRRIHPRTVQRQLKECGIVCRRPCKGQVLTRCHRQRRMDWANQKLNVQRQNWARVVFSDVSCFNLSFADGRIRCYRRRNERFADNCVLERNRFGGGSVMVWGAINARFRSNLIILDGTLTARRYIDGILIPLLLPLLRRQRQNQNLIFQQDNARLHSARVTQDFLRQNGVNVMDWPADMNPIEHMWDELGRRVRERPNPPQNLQELGLTLQQEWQNIPRRTVRRLTRSMRQRLRAVIENNGGQTRY